MWYDYILAEIVVKRGHTSHLLALFMMNILFVSIVIMKLAFAHFEDNKHDLEPLPVGDSSLPFFNLFIYLLVNLRNSGFNFDLVECSVFIAPARLSLIGIRLL